MLESDLDKLEKDELGDIIRGYILKKIKVEVKEEIPKEDVEEVNNEMKMEEFPQETAPTIIFPITKEVKPLKRKIHNIKITEQTPGEVVDNDKDNSVNISTIGVVLTTTGGGICLFGDN